MRDFMVQQAQKNAPELVQLDRSIEAQKRMLLSARLAHVVPTVGFGFSLDHLLATGGKEAADLSSMGSMGAMFGEQDDTSWSAAFSLSWPLFEGGGTIHQHMMLSKELSALKVQREQLAEQLEQRVRAAMHNAGASYPGIALTAQAAAAARKSLELVTEAYARGATSLIALLDTQNAYINAELGAAVARYAFYIDFVGAQRAIGNSGFFTFEPAAWNSWFDRLDRFRKQRSEEKQP